MRRKLLAGVKIFYFEEVMDFLQAFLFVRTIDFEKKFLLLIKLTYFFLVVLVYFKFFIYLLFLQTGFKVLRFLAEYLFKFAIGNFKADVAQHFGFPSEVLIPFEGV